MGAWRANVTAPPDPRSASRYLRGVSVVSRPAKKRTPTKARLLFLAYALGLAAPRLLIMLGITLGGGLFYRERVTTVTGKPVDFVEACYQVYTQLFFEHATALPKDAALRALFFFVPLVGALVLAEGLFKLGASLLDFRTHREEWMRIMAKTYTDHVILVGLGHVGFRALEELLARDILVVAIERQDGSPFIDEARAQGVPVVIGDARRESLLHELGVANASAIVACTDDDLVNLEVALDAKAVNPRIRIVMRMFDQKMAHKIGGAFSVDSTFSTSAISAPLFAAAALDEQVHGAYRLGDSMMVSVELRIEEGSAIDGLTVQDIETKLKAPIVGIHRTGSAATHNFARSERLKGDDAIICHVASDEVGDLRARAGA
jgi:Trk K+ transport system NAD-binding subunit